MKTRVVQFVIAFALCTSAAATPLPPVEHDGLKIPPTMKGFIWCPRCQRD